jgi:hypothetical protein
MLCIIQRLPAAYPRSVLDLVVAGQGGEEGGDFKGEDVWMYG